MDSSRRGFLQTVGGGAAGLALSGTSLSAVGEGEAGDEPVLRVGDNIAVANTQHGKVRGYILRGIHHFLGVPYGADTSGANRFRPPQKPKPWTDTYPALWWGNSAPQEMDNRYANKHGAFRDHWNYDDVSEDCLKINVFTPANGDGKKRPVMFWLHGGGFNAGNAIEHDGYNGENFARVGDVVFCSINHRLGPLGFSNLSAVGGREYATSGNVGMLDCVAALEWVRDNISNFGGDPNNVTIMGQSGGGHKVCALLAMPSAKGLFHKAVALSGARLKMVEKDYSEKLGAYLLKEASLGAAEIEKLQHIPWKDFLALATRAAKALDKDLGTPPPSPPNTGIFSPVVDGSVLPQHPFSPQSSATAAAVPMIICSTTNEGSPSWTDSRLETMTLDEAIGRLGQRPGYGGGKAKQLIEAYAKAFPGRKPVELFSYVDYHRQAAVGLADVKSKQAAPVYLAWFGWQPPLFDGRLRAFHTLDICFWYRNTDLMITHTGGGARPRKLSEKMARSLVQFMRSGDPNVEGLPSWPKYATAAGEVMILDDVCEVKPDPDREARALQTPLTA